MSSPARRLRVDRRVGHGNHAAPLAKEPFSERNGGGSYERSRNTRTVKEFFAAAGRGDAQGLLALCAEDIEWIIPGESAWAGRKAEALTRAYSTLLGRERGHGVVDEDRCDGGGGGEG